MTELFNLVLTVAAVIMGIVGLSYLLKARSKMGDKLKGAGVYLLLAVVVFIIQGIGDVSLLSTFPSYVGVWAATTFLIGMFFFMVGFKKLADTFS